MIHYLKQILRDRMCLGIMLLGAILLFGIMIVIPLLAIPGNTLKTQLGVLMFGDYLILILFALLAGLNFAIPVYAHKRRCAQNNLSSGAAEGTVSVGASLFGTVAGTTACAACVVPLFTALGLSSGSAWFVLNHSFYFSLAALLILLVTSYWGIKRIQKWCRTC